FGAEYEQWVSASNLWARDASYAERDTWQELTIRNIAGFAEHQWDIDGEWSTTVGLRVDDHNIVGTNVSPRLALNRRIGTDHFARLSFSSGYRLPTAIELGIEEFFFRVDDEIEAEDIDSLDLSWQGKVDDVGIRAGAFYNRTNGLLWFQPVAATDMQAAWIDWLVAGDNTQQPGPFFELQNLDNPNHGVGLELASDWKVNNNITLWGNGTWQHYAFENEIRYQSDGFVDPYSGNTLFRFDETFPDDINAPPQWKFNAGVQFQTGPIFATAIVRYVGDRTIFSFPNSQIQGSGPLAVQEVPAYAALDLAIGWMHQHADGRVSSIRIAIMDLANNRHYETYQASTDGLLLDDEVQFSAENGRKVALVGDLKF
ncbi:MAG: TonB-dependent receptor, partial [Planctomycetota bacterium]|nr:TonB-dependent receptor [Planctomycetota bacterium]